ncbi:MAG TPA: helix-hairpin-helix domain-containing protein [Thermodesulfobacteriota bacterium]
MAWSGPIGAAAALTLAILGAAAGWRAAAGWGSSDGARRPPLQTAVAPASRNSRAAAPLLEPDPMRILVDVVRVGDRPRLVALPAGARLADLLAAAGLPAGTPVAGSRSARARLLPGSRLLVTPTGRAALGCMPAVRRLRLGLPLDLNADAAADLDRLPGIGPVLAARIVADRARRGPFTSVQALVRVPGVGPSTAAAVGPFAAAAPDTRCGRAHR